MSPPLGEGAYDNLFLDAKDVPPGMLRREDNRHAGRPAGDTRLFDTHHGQGFGLAVWLGNERQSLWRMVDIRWVFASEAAAAAFHREGWVENSERMPQIAGVPTIGPECAAFGGQNRTPLSGETVTHFLYLFRIGRVVIKLYAAEGINPSVPLKITDLTPLAQRIGQRVEESLRDPGRAAVKLEPVMPFSLPGQPAPQRLAMAQPQAGGPVDAVPPAAIGTVQNTYPIPRTLGKHNYNGRDDKLSFMMGPAGCFPAGLLGGLGFIGVLIAQSYWPLKFPERDMIYYVWGLPGFFLGLWLCCVLLPSRTMAWLGEHGAAVWHKYPLRTAVLGVVDFNQAAFLVKESAQVDHYRNGTKEYSIRRMERRWLDRAGHVLLHLHHAPGNTKWDDAMVAFGDAAEKAFATTLVPRMQDDLRHGRPVAFPLIDVPTKQGVPCGVSSRELQVVPGQVRLVEAGTVLLTFVRGELRSGILHLHQPAGEPWVVSLSIIANGPLFLTLADSLGSLPLS